MSRKVEVGQVWHGDDGSDYRVIAIAPGWAMVRRIPYEGNRPTLVQCWELRDKGYWTLTKAAPVKAAKKTKKVV